MFKKIIINNKETNYSVSDLGEIRNDLSGRILKGTVARNEYHSVQLTIKGKVKSFMVHRLVAEAFCPNPNNYNIVHHKDLNSLNNHADNLQWVTTKENNQKENKKQSLEREKQNFNYEDSDSWTPIALDNDYLICKEGYVYSKKRGLVLKGSIRNGYHRFRINGVLYSTHRVVYETFKGEIKGVIDHIDGNKLNNNLDNLRDVTQSQNMINAQKNGHKGQAPVDQYDVDGNFIKSYTSSSEAAQVMGVTPAAIRSAADRHGSSCGYYWVRKGEQFVKPTRKLASDIIIQQFTLSGELIGEYTSYAEAGRAVGKARQNIYDAVHKGYKTSGYEWKIKEN